MLLTLWERYRRILIAIAILFFLFMSYLLYHDSVPDQAPGGPLTPAYASESDQKLDTQQVAAPQMKLSPRVFIDVKGSVKKPGLYSFEQGARIADAIDKAGGTLPEADLTSINLAQPLLDGSMLVIPKKGVSTKATPCNKQNSTIQSIGSSPNSGAPASSSNNPVTVTDKVNLNTATLQELMTLPGIGESRAKEIIQFREKNGLFQTTDQLKKISGIGEKTYEKLKNKIGI